MHRFTHLAALTICLTVFACPLFGQDEEVQAQTEAQAARVATQVAPTAEPNPARDLLAASRQKLVEAGAFSASIELFTRMDQRFTDMMPSANGQYRAKASEAGEPAPWMVRVTGTGRAFGRPQEHPFDVLWKDGRVTTVEHVEKTVIDGPAANVRGTSFSQVRSMLGIPGLVDGLAPYGVALDDARAEIRMSDPVTVDSVECHQIQVTARQGRATLHYTIVLGVEDLLPRRVTLHPRGFETEHALGCTLTNVSIDPAAMGNDTWAISVPEGYSHDVLPEQAAARTPPRPSPQGNTQNKDGQWDAQVEDEGELEDAKEAPEKRPTPLYQQAPRWNMTDQDGKAYSQDSLNGHVSVLYFWGTWCIPCRRAAPMNIEMFEEFSENKYFQMIGMAVRERDPKAAYDYAKDNGHTWKQLVGADKPATLFGVERYPTWIVVGHEGQILYTSGRPEEGDFAPIFTEMRAAIQRGLDMVAKAKN